jgi:penicillin-binding protein 1C
LILVRRIVLLILLFPAIAFIILNRIFPLPDIYGEKDFSKVVLDAGGRPIRYFADSNGEWRHRVDISEVSDRYLEALIEYEDKYFYKHPGVNPFSLVRAAYQNFGHGRIISGGSTLTMQVARLIKPHKRS